MANAQNLTPNDMKKIYEFTIRQYNKYLGGEWNGRCWSEEFYEEVLKNFNEFKEGENNENPA